MNLGGNSWEIFDGNVAKKLAGNFTKIAHKGLEEFWTKSMNKGKFKGILKGCDFISNSKEISGRRGEPSAGIHKKTLTISE